MSANLLRPSSASRLGTGGDAPLSPELDALADRVRRLLPSHRDPEAFHVERDSIERALRRLAQKAPSRSKPLGNRTDTDT